MTLDEIIAQLDEYAETLLDELADDEADDELQAAAEADDDGDDTDEEIEAKAANYGARVGQTIAGNLGRGNGGRFARAGSGKPGADATDKRVLNERRADGQRLAKQVATDNRVVLGKGKGKGKAKAKAKAKTPAEKQVEKAQKQAENRTATFQKLGLAEDATGALMDLAAGNNPEDDGGLLKMGLAAQDADGNLRLTPQGRALLAAAKRGDAGRARDALSLGKDRAKAASERDAAKQERERKKQEKAKEKGGGGGGGAKPSKAEQRAQNRQSITQEMADRDQGLAPGGMETLLSFADGKDADPKRLEMLAAQTGLLEVDTEGAFRLSREGRTFVRAVDKADMRAALDALSRSVDRIGDDETKSLDYERGAGITRQAFSTWWDRTRRQLRQSDDYTEPVSGPWVEAVFDDAVVVQQEGRWFRVAYDLDSEGLYHFAGPDQWARVEPNYVPIAPEAPDEQPEALDAAQMLTGADLLITYGAEVKALGKGKVGGYLVRYSTENDPDLPGDFFDATTDFGDAVKTDIYYNHGLDPRLGKRKLGNGTLKADDVGIWVEAQLNLRDEYERAIYAMAKAGKLGWSSGTANHLVERVPTGKAAFIKSWPLGLDASLTPTPAEPRNAAVSLKSIAPDVSPEVSPEATTPVAARTVRRVIVPLILTTRSYPPNHGNRDQRDG